ncbi:hypothetical protein [Parahaliea mediterranea]|nr:hypothetical protein [Parahaliea mediterranea]
MRSSSGGSPAALQGAGTDAVMAMAIAGATAGLRARFFANKD